LNDDWLVCERTRSTAAQLDAALRAAVTTQELQLRVMALHLIERGGKRLRPVLLLLAASFGACPRDRLLRAAAALELIHIASLYHDDVMDRATVRRAGTSANARWGNSSATFAGTYLFARATSLLATLGNQVNRLASGAAVDLCSGQLLEVENAFNLEVTEDEQLKILARKTATLFELPCRIGAFLGGLTPTQAGALARYGRLLGMAFQLADDTLDLAGDTAEVGKDTGNDLRQGVYSLPMLRAVRGAGSIGKRLQDLLSQAQLSEEDMAAVLRLVRESGAIREGLAMARSFAAAARAALRRLPDGPHRHSLVRLTEFVAARSR
jgi:heptaprenyl diphosphate synthase